MFNWTHFETIALHYVWTYKKNLKTTHPNCCIDLCLCPSYPRFILSMKFIIYSLFAKISYFQLKTVKQCDAASRFTYIWNCFGQNRHQNVEKISPLREVDRKRKFLATSPHTLWNFFWYISTSISNVQDERNSVVE